MCSSDLVVFERDDITGLLTVLQVLQDDDSINPISGATKVPGLDRALGVAVSADGQNVYATGHRAVHALNSLNEGDFAAPVVEVLPVDLIKRASTPTADVVLSEGLSDAR